MKKTILALVISLNLVACKATSTDNPEVNASYTICETHNCGDPVNVEVVDDSANKDNK